MTIFHGKIRQLTAKRPLHPIPQWSPAVAGRVGAIGAGTAAAAAAAAGAAAGAGAGGSSGGASDGGHGGCGFGKWGQLHPLINVGKTLNKPYGNGKHITYLW